MFQQFFDEITGISVMLSNVLHEKGNKLHQKRVFTKVIKIRYNQSLKEKIM